MKKLLAGTALFAISSASFAVAPGGPGCGWGNLLMEGKAGMGPHFLATTTNGTSGNATFGMTSGTNGCDTSGTLTYGGKSLIGAIMDEFSEDVAVGEGEALTAVAVSLEVAKADRDHFNEVMHDNFETLFPSADVTAEHVHNALISLMKSDARLQQYVS